MSDASSLRPLAALWLLAFSFYALTGTGHTSSWDSALMLFSARSFLDRGDLSVPAYPGTELLRKTGRDGREYVKFAPALIFAHVPMLAVARIANDLPLVSLASGDRPPRRVEDEFWVQLTNAWVTASVLVLLALFVIELGGSWREAWLAVLLVGLAGPLWLYAKADGPEALQALGLLGAAYFLHRASHVAAGGAADRPLSPRGEGSLGRISRRTRIATNWSDSQCSGEGEEPRDPGASPPHPAPSSGSGADLSPKGEVGERWAVVLAGTCCGLNVLAKTFNVVLIPCFIGYLLFALPRRRVRGAMQFLVPVAAALVLTGIYNHARFGSPFDSGYDLEVERFDAPLVPGALKLLFSPSYGLLVFWPASLLVLAGVRRRWREHRSLTLLIVAIFLSLLLLYSSWWAFSGFGWGPRFLVPAVPLLALLALPVIGSRRRAARVLTIGCLAVGLAVQAVVVTTNHWQQIIFGVYREIDCGDYAERCIDDPRVAPLRVAWWRIEGAFLRARHPERLDPHLEAPPWSDAYPWLSPETVVERQRKNTGLDFWAAPSRWRLERSYLWAPALEGPVPRSPALAAGLLVVFLASLVLVLRHLRRARRAPAGMAVPADARARP